MLRLGLFASFLATTLSAAPLTGTLTDYRSNGVYRFDDQAGRVMVVHYFGVEVC